TSIYRANKEVFGESEPADFVFRIIRGVVRAYKLLSDGRRQITAFYFPGDVFGLEPTDHYSVTAEAVVTAHVMVCKRRQMLSVAAQNVGAAREIWSFTAQSLAHAESHLLLLGRKTALERIESFLLEMNERALVSGQLNLPMTRRDIADYLGLTLETVSRALAQLEEEGELQLDGPRKIMLRRSGDTLSLA